MQSLPKLTGFLSIGTVACLTAPELTIAKLAASPKPAAQHDVCRFTAGDHNGETFEAAAAAIMNFFFAFGALLKP